MRRCDPLSLQLSDALDARRRQLDRTVADVAHAARLHRDSVGDALDGRTVRTSTLSKLLAALDCNLVVRLQPREKA